MIVFLLKSSVCLAIFLMFYKLLLEKARMHIFKRFYLLAALVISLVIPSITFTQYVEVAPTPISTAIVPAEDGLSETAMPLNENVTVPEVITTEIDYWPVVLWMVYGLGVMLFFLKFTINLLKIAGNIRNNSKLKLGFLVHVLLREAVVPHTFLNYIFLNRRKFEAHKIPRDVLIHEATHARQKHSLDILFVELLQIVFWFNPLLHFAKRSIKLNHEFLADAAVLKQGSATSDYQHILLSFASSANYNGNQPSLANAIHYSPYSSIKKRFTVMKTQTSKKSVILKRTLVLPLIALVVFGFSRREKVTRFAPDEKIEASQVQQSEPFPLNINTSDSLKKGNSSKKKTQSQIEKENWRPTEKDFVKWKENEGNFALYIKGKLVENSELDKYSPSDFYHFSIKSVPWNRRSANSPQPYELHLYDHSEFDILVNTKMGKIHVSVNTANQQILVNEKICSIDELADRFDTLKKNFNRNGKIGLMASFSINNSVSTEFSRRIRKIFDEKSRINDNKFLDIDTIYTYKRLAKRITNIPTNQKANIIYLKEIYSKMDDSQKRQVDNPSVTINNRSQEKATYRMIDAYNALAKKYNAIPKKKRTIPSKDLKALENLYGKMSEEQKADASPFPECPNPKASDQKGATKKQIEEYNRLAKTYNKMLGDKGNIRIKKSDVDRLAYLHGLMTDNQRAEAEPFPDFPEPPEPPTPPSSPDASDLNDEEYAENRIDNIIENQDPYDGNTIRLNSGSRNLKHTIDINHVDISTPPSPPTPKTPLNFIKEMTEKNARFYYEGEAISSEKAIELMKKNRNINIDAKGENGQNPIVRLSTEPIEIEK